VKDKKYQGLLDTIKYLIDLEKEQLKRVSGTVDYIISTNYQDVNDIEHVFDRMLDLGFIPAEELSIPYFKLLDYVRPLDSESASAYEGFFQEKYNEDIIVENPKIIKIAKDHYNRQ